MGRRAPAENSSWRRSRVSAPLPPGYRVCLPALGWVSCREGCRSWRPGQDSPAAWAAPWCPGSQIPGCCLAMWWWTGHSCASVSP